MVTGVRSALPAADASVRHLELDLALPTAPAELVEAATAALGHLVINSENGFRRWS